MSKINEIQNALKQIEQARFQKLCDALLINLGYKEIISIGVTEGKDRTRTGTPDTLRPLRNGNYWFIEYSVQQTVSWFSVKWNFRPQKLDTDNGDFQFPLIQGISVAVKAKSLYSQ